MCVAAAVVLTSAAIGRADDTAPGGASTAKSDGARFLPCGAALVTASSGSRLSSSCEGGALVALEDGAFRIVAGSKGVRITAGGTALDASNARLEIARIGGRWLARGVADGDAPLPGALAAGGIVELGGAAGGPLAGGDAAAFDKAVARAAPVVAPNRALVRRKVEAPIASGAAVGAAGEGAADVEVESIEVEVGCIEVCVD
jgi:hypothetical protein